MLQTIGTEGLDDLFRTIPKKLDRPLNLPSPLTEIDLRHHLRELSRKNRHGEEWTSFLGGGAYAHYIPSAVSPLIQRGEFLTAYTPYQPEVSQGTLQAIFEYQTMVAEIFGMEIANASNYDGSTATAEAALMAMRLTDRGKILVARTLHPEYRQVLETYLSTQEAEIREIPYRPDGTLDRQEIKKNLDKETACLIAPTPNFFGIVEDFSDLSPMLHQEGALLVTSTPEPLSLGLFKSPGEMGADIAVGEGQGFGNPLCFGGPSLGLFAARREFARAMPGRLVGETVDTEGRRGFVLTLSTREQHIRRERATSNICTNVALCALAATITLALWGREGFSRLARINYERAEALRGRLQNIQGFRTRFSGTTFNEFVLECPERPQEILRRLRDQKILGGLFLESWYPELGPSLLVCVTELVPEDQIDRFAKVLEEF